MRRTFAIAAYFLLILSASGQDSVGVQKQPAPPPAKKWYDEISLRGYAQVRYNRLLETNPDLECEQCDRSWGDGGGFFFRRIRLIFFGNVHERVYIYIQPDFASAPTSNSSLNFGQIRDAYFDLALDKKREFRLRFGQSKVPYGFENLQSSQNRLPLDRADATNSAVANERDIGVFFYWAPKEIRDRFSYLVRAGLKGSGDYGVFGLGVFNGQTANRQADNDRHVVVRLSYPFLIGRKQIIEPGIQAYTGNYTVTTKNANTLGINPEFLYNDQRVAYTLVKYPQPLGFSAEWTQGTGPEFNPANNTIEQRRLEGGYAQIMYKLDVGNQTFIPFTRGQYYNGGKKHELDARKYRVRELELGVEWAPFENFELVVMYTMSNRTFEDYSKPVNNQVGNLLRIQAQFNY